MPDSERPFNGMNFEGLTQEPVRNNQKKKNKKAHHAGMGGSTTPTEAEIQATPEAQEPETEQQVEREQSQIDTETQKNTPQPESAEAKPTPKPLTDDQKDIIRQKLRREKKDFEEKKKQEWNEKRAKLHRIGITTGPTVTFRKMDELLVERQNSLEIEAEKINANQDVSDLSAAQLLVYTELAKHGGTYEGQTFDEVSKTKEYSENFSKAHEEQEKLIESWKTKPTGVNSSSSNKIEPKMYFVTEDQISGLDETERNSLQNKYPKLPSSQRKWNDDSKIITNKSNFGVSDIEAQLFKDRMEAESERSKNPQPKIETDKEREPESNLLETKFETKKENAERVIGFAPPKSETEKPKEPEQKLERKKLYIAELSDYVDVYARRQAQEKYREIYDKSKLARLWLHPFENYYVTKFYSEARRSIENNKNLMTLLEARVTGKVTSHQGNEQDSYDVMDAIIKAYVEDLGLKEHEKAEKIDDERLNQKLGNLCYLNFKYNWTRQEFDQELAHALHGVYKAKDDKEGKVFASDIWKYMESHRYQLENLVTTAGPESEQALRDHISGLMNVDIYLGRKDSDIRQEPKKLNALESLQAGIQNSKIMGSVANPAVMGAFISLVFKSGTRGGLRTGLTTATAIFIAPTIAPVLGPLLAGAGAGAAFAYMRRRKETKEDWTQERMQVAMGREAVGANAKAVREYILKMEDASEIAQALGAANVSKDLIAETCAKLELENQGSQEFFHASKENERLGSRQVDMNKLYAALKEIRSKPEFSGEEFDKLIATKQSELKDQLIAKEEAFGKFRGSQSRKAAMQGAFSGFVGGLISQELIAGAKELAGHTGGDTLVRHVIRGEWNKHLMDAKDLAQTNTIIGANGFESTIHSAPGFNFVDHGHNTMDYVYNGEHVADNLTFNEHGLTAASKKILEEKGFKVLEFHDKTQIVPDAAHNIVKNSMPNSVLEQLKEKFHDTNWSHTPKRIDWHHEGPQESSWFHKVIEHPGKEQMLYVSKAGNGIVSVDAHKIVENFAQNLKDHHQIFNNPDGSVDHKMTNLIAKLTEWNNKGELGKHIEAVVLPDRGAAIGSTFAADSTGHINLSESLSKIVTDTHDGKLPFTIELRLDDGHVLATASGQGMLKNVIETVAKTIPQTLEVNNTYIVPQLFEEMNPAIATPMARRYHLETIKINSPKKELGDTPRKPIKPKIAAKRKSAPEPDVEDFELNSLNEEPEEEQVDLPLNFREPESKVKVESFEKLESEAEQMDLPEDMRIYPNESEKLSGEKIVKNEILLEAIEDALAVLPHIKTKHDMEKVLTAEYRMLLPGDKKEIKRVFARFMHNTFGFEMDQWKINRRKDKFYVKLADKKSVVPILEKFRTEQELIDRITHQLEIALTSARSGSQPKPEINLLGDRSLEIENRFQSKKTTHKLEEEKALNEFPSEDTKK